MMRPAPGDARSYLATRSGTDAKRVILNILDQIWQDGFIIGAVSAWKMSPDPQYVPKGSVTVTCDAGHDHDCPGAAGLLIRSRNKEGKKVYLLHKRDDGTWATPGGGLHPREDAFTGALRESTEEIGPLPQMRDSHRVVDDHGGWAYTMYIVDVRRPFQPQLDEGTTPDEVTGAGWFTRKEMRDIPLHEPFADNWRTYRKSIGDTVINSAAGKSWRYRSPLDDADKAPIPPDPRVKLMNRLIRAGIPRAQAMQLAAAFMTWEQTYANALRTQITETLLKLIARIMRRQQDGKITQDEAKAELNRVLRDEGRARRIALTELTRLSGVAALEVYKISEVDFVRWVTEHDAKVCQACRQNAEAGPVAVRADFPSGDAAPPAHPNCRCAIIPTKDKDPFAVSLEDWIEPYHKGGQVTGARDWLSSKSAETPVVSTVHHQLGHEGLWHTPDRHVGSAQQLPAYIQNVARALMRDHGMGESQAIATAINAVKDWAAGRAWGGRVKVTPEVRAAAGRAVAEWESLRASHHKCLSCGCHMPDHEHDDDRHFTLRDLQDAAETAGISTRQAAENIADTTRAMPVSGNPWLTSSLQEACG